MTPRPRSLAIALGLVAALAVAPRAHAASFLGSLDTSSTPDAYACDACAPGTAMGFRQFALRGATVEAPEAGVLVSASVYAKRLSGSEPARIAILRPADEDGVGLTVVDSAPVPVTSASGDLVRVDDLHLAMERGDSIGFLFRAGEVDLGVRSRPKPDGATQWFGTPCAPCGMDGGTGTELLLDAVEEPDVDSDGMGDETQDPDGGGLGNDWISDWFADWDAGDQLDPDFDFGDDGPAGGQRAPRSLRLLSADRARNGRVSVLLAIPKPGRVSVDITLPANRRSGAGPFETILTGEMRARRAGRARLRLTPTPAGARALTTRKRVRTKVVIAYFPRKSTLELLMRSARF